jgi:hypothetical protein
MRTRKQSNITKTTKIFTLVSILNQKKYNNGLDLKCKTHSICCPQEIHLTEKGKHRIREKGWEKISQANVQKKKDRSSYIHVR